SEVIQDGRRNQRDSRGAGVEANSFMFQEAAHPRGSFQAERAAASENDRVNAFGKMRRAEQSEFFGTGGGAADIDACRGAALHQNRRAAGEAVVIRNVAYQNAADVR